MGSKAEPCPAGSGSGVSMAGSPPAAARALGEKSSDASASSMQALPQEQALNFEQRKASLVLPTS